MKKTIIFLSVVIMAIALFFNTNAIKTSDLNLANLLSMNVADAESPSEYCDTYCEYSSIYSCIITHNGEGWSITCYDKQPKSSA